MATAENSDVYRRGTVFSSGLAYLDSLEPWVGAFKAEPTLIPLRAVMAALGDPQDSIPAIHVAGTNGKGSVSVAIAAMLGASGYRVGLTTSPHLVSIHERIVIDGVSVSDEMLDRSLLQVCRAALGVNVTLSHFEALTAAAFVVFAQAGLDYIVVEVGLGGRLDATNILRKPLIGVVTTIDYDHEAILGETLAKIAAEKAGIVKPGMKLVIGDMVPEAFDPIVRRARDLGVETYSYGHEFNYDQQDAATLVAAGSRVRIAPSLQGDYQLRNMAVAAQVGLLLGLEPGTCERGISSVAWPGRLETVHWRGRELLIDAAHNPQGVRSYVSYVKARGLVGLPVLFGVIDTKNWREMLRELIPVVGEFYLVQPDFPRAVPGHELQRELSCSGIKAVSYDLDYEAAIGAASQTFSSVVGVAGSMYLIGKIRGACDEALPCLWRRG